jgi:hypothetical protein
VSTLSLLTTVTAQSKEDDALHFGGLSFYRRSDDSIDGYIVMRDGEITTEHHLEYKRR